MRPKPHLQLASLAAALPRLARLTLISPAPTPYSGSDSNFDVQALQTAFTTAAAATAAAAGSGVGRKRVSVLLLERDSMNASACEAPTTEV